MHRVVREKLRAAKTEWIEGHCIVIEKGIKSGDSKKAYNTLKYPTKTNPSRAVIIYDNESKLLIDRMEVLNR